MFVFREKARAGQGLLTWTKGRGLRTFPVGAGTWKGAGPCQARWVTPSWTPLWAAASLISSTAMMWELLFQLHGSVLHFQAKETNSKQKEFEETAKKVRCAIEQLAGME